MLIPTMRLRAEIAPLLPAIAAVVIASGLFFGGYDSPLGQSLSALLNSLLLAIVLLFLPPAPPQFWKGVAAPLACFAGALAWLATVALARAPFAGEPGELPLAPDLFLPRFLGLVGGLWALLLGLLIGRLPALRDRAADWLLGSILAYLLLALLLPLLPGGRWDEASILLRGRLAGLAGNVNVTATVSGVAAVLAFSRWIGIWAGAGQRALPGDRRSSLFYGAALAVAMIALIFTGSRFPMLVTLAALGALPAWWWLVEGDARPFPVSRLMLGVAALTVAGATLLSRFLVERMGSLGADGYIRAAFWADFARFAGYAPWTGYGPGAFASVHAYFLKDAAGLPSAWAVNSPHSILLQLLLVGGIPYLLLLLAGAGLIARQLLAGLRAARRGMAQLGLVLALLLIFACALVDIFLDMPAGVAIGLFLAGLAWAGAIDAGRAEARQGA